MITLIGFSLLPLISLIFKSAYDELKLPMTALFNLCIETNRIPSDWKIALVRPHYKGK